MQIKAYSLNVSILLLLQFLNVHRDASLSGFSPFVVTFLKNKFGSKVLLLFLLFLIISSYYYYYCLCYPPLPQGNESRIPVPCSRQT